MPVTISSTIGTKYLFTCSDGKVFRRPRGAYKHEMYLRIPTLFPQSAIEQCRTFKPGRYHLGRHMFIRCGVYHIILKDAEDMSTLNHFFRGIRVELGSPKKDDYPIEFDLEIFYEFIPNALMNSAQWRLWDDGSESHGN